MNSVYKLNHLKPESCMYRNTIKTFFNAIWSIGFLFANQKPVKSSEKEYYIISEYAILYLSE